jgi:hypothetical protein
MKPRLPPPVGGQNLGYGMPQKYGYGIRLDDKVFIF